MKGTVNEGVTAGKQRNTALDQNWGKQRTGGS